jgi:hypothetical protein
MLFKHVKTPKYNQASAQLQNPDSYLAIAMVIRGVVGAPFLKINDKFHLHLLFSII